MTIRNAEVYDFDPLYALWKTSGIWTYPKQKDKKRYKDILKLNRDLCFVLTDENNEIIGSILSTHDGRTVVIQRVCIHPKLQKRGYGKMLITYLENACREKGLQKVVAQVHESNLSVEGFYKKIAFEHDPLVTYKKYL